MGNFIEKGVKLIIALVVLSIIFSIISHLFTLAIRLAVIGAIGYGGYLGAKKIGLLK